MHGAASLLRIDECSTAYRNPRARVQESLCCHLFPTEDSMNLHITIGPLISLVAGVLILVMPKLLNYIVAIYLIVIGLIGLLGT
jgi:hypothetical protein